MKAKPLPAHVREAGERIARELYDANLARCLGSHAVVIDNDPANKDLIDACMEGKLSFVEAVYIAMNRAAKVKE